MNKLYSIISAFAVFATTAVAQTESLAIKATDSNDDTHHYYYNESNQLFWELYSTTRRVYTYNDAGLPASMIQYSWVEAEKAFAVTINENYTYDAQGNMVEKVTVNLPGSLYEVSYTYKYFDFVNGVATYYDEYKNGNLYYMYKQVSEFDAANRQTSCTVYYADPDDYPNPTHETVDYKGLETKYSKTYDADGKLISENKKSTDYSYVYADLNGDYAPKNLKAVNANGNVTLTWDAVAGAEKYIVSYDLQRVEVTSVTYSAVVGTGSREFTVQAVIDGVERNATTPVVADISDAGKLPITDLAVGTITLTEEATESADLATRSFYNISLSWSIPEGHSEILKYNVYYNSTAYGNDYCVAVTNPEATSFVLKVDPFEMVKWNADGVPSEGIETPIYITVVYATGESAKSNVVVVNPFNLLGDPSAINAPQTVSASGNAYTLSGQRAGINTKGIVIKDGKKVWNK